MVKPQISSCNVLDKTTVSDNEVLQFEALANQWWDADGAFAPLHKINPVRLAYIKDHLCDYFNLNPLGATSLKHISIIDIGCGGGLICEPLARLGASVTGIDAGKKNISVASLHSEQSNLSINYLNMTPEEALREKFSFDVVINLQVIEHVPNISHFISICAQLVKPGGVMISATLNRTIKSLLTAKIGAEYILRWLPRGTHEWGKFVKPSEFCALLNSRGLVVKDITGLAYRFMYDEWVLSDDIDVNYLIFAIKK